MAKNIGTKNLYILITAIFLVVFGYDMFKVFTSINKAEESLQVNKYAQKIEDTKRLGKVFDKPLFDTNFLNDFKSYGQWPLEGTARSRGSEIFSLPETNAEQLLNLDKTKPQTAEQPAIPVRN